MAAGAKEIAWKIALLNSTQDEDNGDLFADLMTDENKLEVMK